MNCYSNVLPSIFQEVLECVKQLHFDMVEECWITFWQPENDQEDMEDEDCASNECV